MKPRKYKITKHAFERFKERGETLGLDTSEDTLHSLIENAKIERINKRKWNQVRRVLKDENILFLVNNGWRFVVDTSKNRIVTIERVKPNENWIVKFDKKWKEMKEDGSTPKMDQDRTVQDTNLSPTDQIPKEEGTVPGSAY